MLEIIQKCREVESSEVKSYLMRRVASEVNEASEVE